MAVSLIALVLGVFLALIYGWLLYRPGPPPAAEPFDGVMYRVGSAWISERSAAAADKTVICMHGFCESARYFTRHYSDPGWQLILLTSGDYYPALAAAEGSAADWAIAPKAVAGTIEYDAEVLLQALMHLPKTQHVRVHGHSRGGAVVLEAAAMRPQLFQDVEVILEAPVLPQGKLRQAIAEPLLWLLLPLLLPLWRRRPIPPVSFARWGALDDARKRELIAALPFNARRAITLLANIRSITRWMRERSSDLYRHLDSGAVLIPSDDQVLDADHMRRSVVSSGAPLRIVDVEASHFVLLDKPAAIPPLPARSAAAPQEQAT